MKMIKSLLALMLGCCLMLPTLPATAFADGVSAPDAGSRAIQLGTGNVSGYSDTGSYDYVYFGNWTAPDGYTTTGPIKWRVLDDKTNTGSDGMFLLSDSLLGSSSIGGVRFGNGEPWSSVWQGSHAQAWCKDFAGEAGAETNVSDAFASGELGAVLPTTKSDGKFVSSTKKVDFSAAQNILNGDKVFFLSAEEAENANYGLSNDVARAANYGTGTYSWWLRSPWSSPSTYAGQVTSSGAVDYNFVYYNMGARPAFNLDSSKVLMVSAASSSKTDSSVDGNLTAVTYYRGTEWKLTLLDSGRSFSATSDVDGAVVPGSTIEIQYSGARSGDNEYVSAMILNEDDRALYYGRLAQVSEGAESGSASMTVPSDLSEGDYTLKVFSEQYNGNKKTDYASAITSIDLSISQPAPSVAKKTITLAVDAIASGDKTNQKFDYVYYGSYEDAPIKWRVLSKNGNGGTYTDSANCEASDSCALFLMSEYALGLTSFGSNSTWAGSSLQQWCQSFFTSGAEAGYVLQTSKDEEHKTGNVVNSALDNDTFFSISCAEAFAYFANGSSNLPATGVDGSNVNYWTRDHVSSGGYTVPVVVYGNATTGWACSEKFRARPAFNLDSTEVVFSSAAVSGKASAVDGALTAVNDYDGNEWKLTMNDSSREFWAYLAFYDGATRTATVPYFEATVGNNEYVSALILDESDNITYYGRLKNITEESEKFGSVDIVLPEGFNAEKDTLYVFSEQCNGDYKTDFASDFEEIDIPAEGTTYEVHLEPRGGTIAEGKDVTSYTFGVGAKLPTADDITREGYVFQGWFTSDDYLDDEPVTEITPTDVGDATLYAKWYDPHAPIIIGLEDGKTYSGPVEFDVDDKCWHEPDGEENIIVTVNGVEIYFDDNGKYWLQPAEGPQKVVATNKVGNSAQVTVMVNDGHAPDPEPGPDSEPDPDPGDAHDPSTCRFSDVDYSAYYADSVTFLHASNIMNGYTDVKGKLTHVFGVGDALTRAELVTAIWRMENPWDAKNYNEKAAKDSTGIKGAADGKYYTKAVNWAVANGILTGYELADGSFDLALDEDVTFEQLTTILARIATAGDMPEGGDLSAFADADAVDEWALPGMWWAVEVGVVEGYDWDGGRFLMPKENVPRERCATVLARAIQGGLL